MFDKTPSVSYTLESNRILATVCRDAGRGWAQRIRRMPEEAFIGPLSVDSAALTLNHPPWVFFHLCFVHVGAYSEAPEALGPISLQGNTPSKRTTSQITFILISALALL